MNDSELTQTAGRAYDNATLRAQVRNEVMAASWALRRLRARGKVQRELVAALDEAHRRIFDLVTASTDSGPPLEPATPAPTLAGEPGVPREVEFRLVARTTGYVSQGRLPVEIVLTDGVTTSPVDRCYLLADDLANAHKEALHRAAATIRYARGHMEAS